MNTKEKQESKVTIHITGPTGSGKGVYERAVRKAAEDWGLPQPRIVESIAGLNTEQRIKEIKEELRQLYQSDNDAPRLIQEMLKEFPWPRGPRAENGSPMTHNLG
jgi:hypothetical protein